MAGCQNESHKIISISGIKKTTKSEQPWISVDCLFSGKLCYQKCYYNIYFFKKLKNIVLYFKHNIFFKNIILLKFCIYINNIYIWNIIKLWKIPISIIYNYICFYWMQKTSSLFKIKYNGYDHHRIKSNIYIWFIIIIIVNLDHQVLSK